MEAKAVVSGRLIEHPRLRPRQAYLEHRDSCEECNLDGSPKFVMDLCEAGKALWLASRGGFEPPTSRLESEHSIP